VPVETEESEVFEQHCLFSGKEERKVLNFSSHVSRELWEKEVRRQLLASPSKGALEREEELGA